MFTHDRPFPSGLEDLEIDDSDNVPFHKAREKKRMIELSENRMLKKQRLSNESNHITFKIEKEDKSNHSLFNKDEDLIIEGPPEGPPADELSLLEVSDKDGGKDVRKGKKKSKKGRTKKMNMSATVKVLEVITNEEDQLIDEAQISLLFS
ncbi:hypothetical protein BT69DRAFT_1301521 [Atractiella rhizophila]|nr:hypothetical protein BT69DRAFT_1301521 [Atractiella rhizophila]